MPENRQRGILRGGKETWRTTRQVIDGGLLDSGLRIERRRVPAGGDWRDL
ncbi:hypothetical protein G7B21_28960 [Klebsiella pneumoniae]|nr:hypothetical protein [Klebsiella pneumoniae]